MNKHLFTTIFLLSSITLVSGCIEHGDHNYATTTHEEHPHEEALTSLSSFAAHTEALLKAPELQLNQSAQLSLYLTELNTYQPLSTDGIEITLMFAGKGGKDSEEITIAQADHDGVYRLNYQPKFAGERFVFLQVEAEFGDELHQLGRLYVHSGQANVDDHSHDDEVHNHETDDHAHDDEHNHEADKHSHDHEEHNHKADDRTDTSLLPFSKEQQWKTGLAIATVKQDSVHEVVNANAQITARPDGEAYLIAPGEGIVQAYQQMPEVGMLVEKGQILLKFTPRLGGDIDLASMQADVKKSQANLQQTRQEQKRLKGLFDVDAIPEKQLINIRSQLAINQAELEAAQSRLQQFNLGVGTVLRAPVSGKIIALDIANGSYVSEGTPLLQIADMSRLRLKAQVAESDLGKLGTPSGAVFEVHGFNQVFDISEDRGQLIMVGQKIDSETRTIPVTFEFDNNQYQLPLGLAAKAQVMTANHNNALLVPVSAIQDESGVSVVYVQKHPESFERRLVKTGITFKGQVVILSGLKKGERVVSQGAYLLRLSTSEAGPIGHSH